jgi:hypothetical protein
MPIENTVFISYRRANFSWALSVYQNLHSHGYDVFWDVTGIASGSFERVIRKNIMARAHFLVVLTPSALDGVHSSQDWLRREIETAIDAQRNIVPLMFEGFDFRSPPIANKLTGKLAALRDYNALEIPSRYFREAMGHLREWLSVPLEAVLHPVSVDVQQATQRQQQAANLIQHIAGIAEAPLLSAEEHALLETLPPEQQAMMLLQARKQREQLMTSLLTNVQNMYGFDLFSSALRAVTVGPERR